MLSCGSFMFALKCCDLQVAHLARLNESIAAHRPAYLNFRGLGSHTGTNNLKATVRRRCAGPDSLLRGFAMAAAMRDDEREAFDEEVRLTLKEVDRGIGNLKQVAPSIGSE